MGPIWEVTVRLRLLLVLSLLAVALALLVACPALAHPPCADAQQASATTGAATLTGHVVALAPHVLAQAGRQQLLATTTTKRTTYVYITGSGKKYHRHYCVNDHKHYKKTLGWVKKHGYKPCKVCKPPK